VYGLSRTSISSRCAGILRSKEEFNATRIGNVRCKDPRKRKTPVGDYRVNIELTVKRVMHTCLYVISINLFSDIEHLLNVGCECCFPSSRIVRTINSSRGSSVRPLGEVGEEEVRASSGVQRKADLSSRPSLCRNLRCSGRMRLTVKMGSARVRESRRGRLLLCCAGG
jgi:hypothetical protein